SCTTEQKQSRHFHPAESLSLYEASLLSWFNAHFSLDGQQMVFLTPPPVLAPHSSLIHMFETVRCAFGSADSNFTGRIDDEGGWVLDAQQTASDLAKAVRRERPLTLFGTAFN